MLSTEGGGSSSEPAARGQTLPEAAHVLWRRRWLVSGVVCAFIAVTVIISLLEEPIYRAEAVVIVQPREEPGATYSPDDFLREVVGAVVTEDLLREVMEKAGWTSGMKEFEERLYVEDFAGAGDRAGLRVRFVGSGAEQAARAANAYATLFMERVNRLGERRLAGGSLAARAELRQKAIPPESRYSPRLLLRAAIAACAGLMAGIGVALMLEGRGRGWRSVRDVEFTLKIPVLGTVPEYSTDEGGEL